MRGTLKQVNWPTLWSATASLTFSPSPSACSFPWEPFPDSSAWPAKCSITGLDSKASEISPSWNCEGKSVWRGAQYDCFPQCSNQTKNDLAFCHNSNVPRQNGWNAANVDLNQEGIMKNYTPSVSLLSGSSEEILNHPSAWCIICMSLRDYFSPPHLTLIWGVLSRAREANGDVNGWCNCTARLK